MSTSRSAVRRRPLRGLTQAMREVRRSIAVTDPLVDHVVGYDSPQYHDGTFHNRLPSSVLTTSRPGSMAVDYARKGSSGRPKRPVPLVRPELPGTAAEVGATWLGHATVLI